VIVLRHPIALRRFKQLPQRSNEIWQGGLVKLPAWVDSPVDPDGPSYRPTGALWVSLRTYVLHLAFPEEGEVANGGLALKALIEFGLKEASDALGPDARAARPTASRHRHELTSAETLDRRDFPKGRIVWRRASVEIRAISLVCHVRGDAWVPSSAAVYTHDDHDP
jgi:hypothetical protein